MKTISSESRARAGATLVEVLIGTTAASMILGALMIGSIALQRSFSASNQLANTQADLARVADYIARDIRNATSFTAAPNSSTILSVTVGDYYNRRGTPNDPTDDISNSPTLGRTGAVYGSAPVTIRYGRNGNRIFREVSRVDGGATTTSVTWLADDVRDLAVTVDAEGNATVSTASTINYRVPRVGAAFSSVSLVMASQSRNPKP